MDNLSNHFFRKILFCVVGHIISLLGLVRKCRVFGVCRKKCPVFHAESSRQCGTRFLVRLRIFPNRFEGSVN